MVPDIAKPGHSFRGAMSYYLHDKRGPDEAERSTAERVAWTETRNLMTNGPHTATRIMIATAQRADELKASAGIKSSGRKSNAHVYAYSLAWHPDEAPALDRAEMVRAVDQSLKVLGAEQHQAVLVCHRDQVHPHVHVILNRVHPETGKMLSTSNDRRKLSAWAARYERERGMVVTPNRQAKHQAIERKREQHPEPEKRREHVKARTERAAAVPPQERQQPKPLSEAAILKDLSDAQRTRHKAQWAEIAERNKAAREAIYAAHGQTIQAAADEHKAKAKPAWAAYFRAARMSERAFFERERTIVGVLQNALAATPLGARGSLSALFSNVLSAISREAAFRAAQETERAGLAKTVKARLDADIAGIKTQRAAALSVQSLAYAKERGDLAERQNAEKATMREAWRQVYQRRGRDPRYMSKQEVGRQESNPMSMRDQFDKAREAAGDTPRMATETVKLATPAPAPSPAGMVTPPHKTEHQVPKVDRAAEWAKTAAGRDTLAKDGTPPMPSRDWSKASDKTPSSAAPAPKDWSKTATATPASPVPSRDWSKTAEPPRETKPLPLRDRSKDYDRER